MRIKYKAIVEAFDEDPNVTFPATPHRTREVRTFSVCKHACDWVRARVRAGWEGKIEIYEVDEFGSKTHTGHVDPKDHE
jgi:hypothetical protein